MNKNQLEEILKKHKKWLNSEKGGKRADLRGADLRGADLSYADLRGADLDFSCLPLWCGSLSTNFDDRQIIQLTYHTLKAGLHSENVSDEVKHELAKLIDLANKFHRVDECGKINLSDLKGKSNGEAENN